MEDMEKVFVLRKVKLFKMLPGEVLLTLAEETDSIDMQANQIIFKEGDPPTGLFIIVSGKVSIVKNNHVLTELKVNDFFGELALIDNSPRAATAIAKTEGMLLFLDKETFNQITDDLPEVLRVIVEFLLHYLRGYIKNP